MSRFRPLNNNYSMMAVTIKQLWTVIPFGERILKIQIIEL